MLESCERTCSAGETLRRDASTARYAVEVGIVGGCIRIGGQLPPLLTRYNELGRARRLNSRRHRLALISILTQLKGGDPIDSAAIQLISRERCIAIQCKSRAWASMGCLCSVHVSLMTMELRQHRGGGGESTVILRDSAQADRGRMSESESSDVARTIIAA